MPATLLAGKDSVSTRGEPANVEDLPGQLPLRSRSLPGGYRSEPGHEQVQLLDLQEDAVLGHRDQARGIPPANRRSATRRLPVRLQAGAPVVLQDLRVAFVQS